MLEAIGQVGEDGGVSTVLGNRVKVAGNAIPLGQQQGVIASHSVGDNLGCGALGVDLICGRRGVRDFFRDEVKAGPSKVVDLGCVVPGLGRFEESSNHVSDHASGGPVDECKRAVRLVGGRIPQGGTTHVNLHAVVNPASVEGSKGMVVVDSFGLIIQNGLDGVEAARQVQGGLTQTIRFNILLGGVLDHRAVHHEAHAFDRAVRRRVLSIAVVKHATGGVERLVEDVNLYGKGTSVDEILVFAHQQCIAHQRGSLSRIKDVREPIGGLAWLDVVEEATAGVFDVGHSISALGLSIGVRPVAEGLREVPQATGFVVHHRAVREARPGCVCASDLIALLEEARVVPAPAFCVIAVFGAVIQDAAQTFVGVKHQDQSIGETGGILLHEQFRHFPAFVIALEFGAVHSTDQSRGLIERREIHTGYISTDFVEAGLFRGHALRGYPYICAAELAVAELVGEGVEVAGVEDAAATHDGLAAWGTAHGAAVDRWEFRDGVRTLTQDATVHGDTAGEGAVDRPVKQQLGWVKFYLLTDAVGIALLVGHLVHHSARVVGNQDGMQLTEGQVEGIDVVLIPHALAVGQLLVIEELPAQLEPFEQDGRMGFGQEGVPNRQPVHHDVRSAEDSGRCREAQFHIEGRDDLRIGLRDRRVCEVESDRIVQDLDVCGVLIGAAQDEGPAIIAAARFFSNGQGHVVPAVMVKGELIAARFSGDTTQFSHGTLQTEPQVVQVGRILWVFRQAEDEVVCSIAAQAEHFSVLEGFAWLGGHSPEPELITPQIGQAQFWAGQIVLLDRQLQGGPIQEPDGIRLRQVGHDVIDAAIAQRHLVRRGELEVVQPQIDFGGEVLGAVDVLLAQVVPHGEVAGEILGISVVVELVKDLDAVSA